MKKFVSFLLVALLVASSFAMTAQAAETVSVSTSSASVQYNADQSATVAITYTVSGTFANYKMNVYHDSAVSIAAISGVTGNTASGAVAYASAENVSSHSFTVTYTVPAGTPVGSYNVGISVERIRDRDGVYCDVTSVGGGVINVTCDHSYGDWIIDQEATCTTDGAKHRECSVCGDIENAVIPATGHNMQQKHDVDNHWSECGSCGYVEGKEGHVGMDKWTTDHACHWHACSECDYIADKGEHHWVVRENDEWEWSYCTECGDTTNWQSKTDDPLLPMYDNTPHIVLGFVAILFSTVAVVYGVKRKVSK